MRGAVGFGVFSVGADTPRVGFRVAEGVLDLAAAGLGAVFEAPTLNPFLALGRSSWEDTLARVDELVSGGADLVSLERPTAHLPFAVADYVDFYSSLEHATNLGRLFRPDAEALLPNWRHLPVGYHGRAGTVVVSGTPVVRPSGQTKAPSDDAPRYGPSRRLDIELELGFVVGVGSSLGEQVSCVGVSRSRLRRRARERLERARHPGLGVRAARAVPRQVVRDVDRRVGDAARAPRGSLRARAGAGSDATSVPADRGRLGARRRARGRALGHGRLAHERPRPVLDDAAAARPRHGRTVRRFAPAISSRPGRSRARSRDPRARSSS